MASLIDWIIEQLVPPQRRENPKSDRAEELRRELREMEKAFLKYGLHQGYCGVYETGQCTCGFDDIKKRIPSVR